MLPMATSTTLSDARAEHDDYNNIHMFIRARWHFLWHDTKKFRRGARKHFVQHSSAKNKYNKTMIIITRLVSIVSWLVCADYGRGRSFVVSFHVMPFCY